MSIQHKGPTYGVLIKCEIEDPDDDTFRIEDDCRYGLTSWIDLEEIETSEDVQQVINSLTGKDQNVYQDAWNEEGTFSVLQVRGLPPRLSAYAKGVDGPFVDTLADLATALQMLSPEKKGPFLIWADKSNWLPGYLPDTGGHTSEDVVWQFLCETDPPSLSQFWPELREEKQP